MVGATTKRTRKYGKKEIEIVTPKAPKVPRKKPEDTKRFKVLIDQSNFHGEIFKSYKAAEAWIRMMITERHSGCNFRIMELR